MLCPRRGVRERQRRFLDRLVRCGQAALVLAEVFLPGGDAKHLDESVRLFTVAVQLPARRSRAESRLAELPHGLEEGQLLFRSDGVVDRDQDGSGVWLGVKGQSRLWPVDGRPRVEMAGLRYPQKQSGTDRSEQGKGGKEEGWLQAYAVRNQSPEDRACGHRARKGDRVDRDAAGPDPHR